jgi:NADPH:quinone reductase-like Zn-dependent oxidoreductase
MVPCFDLAGVVVAAPPNSPFPTGTEVYTRTSARRTGNAREYTIALTSELAVKPKNLSWEEAASVPLSAFTAYQALFVHGDIDLKNPAKNANKRLLITAASGGVGVWLVQLAKVAGVKDIIGISGPDNVEFVKELGATDVLNYREQDLGVWAKENEKVDVVIDLLGGATLEKAWRAVKKGGLIVGITQPPIMCKPTDGVAEEISDKFFIMEPDGWQLDDVRSFLEAGTVKPVVDSVWSLEMFKDAFARVAGGHSRGKVMIKVQD